jgi:hypothetical protein
LIKRLNRSRLCRSAIPLAALIIFLSALTGCGGDPASTSAPETTPNTPIFAAPTSTATTTTTTTLKTSIPTKTPDPVALTVLSISGGNVEVLKAGKNDWENGREGMTLEPGDKIRTDAGGKALVTFFEGSTVDIQGGTEISLQEMGIGADESTTIRLRQEVGSTISRVKKLMDTGDRYEIETPSAVAAVRGSAMFVGVAVTLETFVGNIEGKITVAAMGIEITLPEGTHSTVNPGGEPSNPEPGSTPTPTPTASTTSTSTTTSTTTTATSTTPPVPVTVKITSLESGDLVTQSIVVSGTVSDPSITEGTITVNGAANSIVITGGTFSVPVMLDEGVNLIVVSVTKDGITYEASVELIPEEPK